MLRMSREDFERAVEEALDLIPEELGQLIDGSYAKLVGEATLMAPAAVKDSAPSGS